MSRYPIATTSWGPEEKQALLDVIESGQFTMGARVQRFESEFAEYFGSRHAVMVNSGSSANLLAMAAMRYVSRGRLNEGDEVIVPAVSWSTTFYPVRQMGMKLRFVDIDLDTLNMDPAQVEAAITPATRAVLAVNLLGAPCNFDRLSAICEQHGLVLLEDNCESMGATWAGRQTGTIGRFGTYSTFFSHHMSTMEGGMVVTDDDELQQILISMRAHGWIRGLPDDNLLCEKTGDEFLDSFRFVLPGYNMRPTELSGAVGTCQLKKMDAFLQARRENGRLFRQLFADFEHVRTQRAGDESSWFGFSMVLEGKLAGRRAEVVSRLRSVGIECRPIVAGNFTKNPVIEHLSHSLHGEMKNAEIVDRDGLFVGNHHYSLAQELHLLRETMDAVVR